MQKILISFFIIALSFSVKAEDRDMTIRDIQYTQNQGGGYDCFPSPRKGSIVTLRGIVTAVENENQPDFFIQDSSSPWGGIYIYNNSITLSVSENDSVEVSGTIDEYYGNTEMKDLQGIQDFGNASTEITPVSAVTGDFSGGCQLSGEKFEGVLVSLNGVIVTALPDEYGEWKGNDGTGECIFGNQLFTYQPQLGQYIQEIKGIVNYAYGNYMVNPRHSSDITEGGFYPVIDSISVSPEEAQTGDTLSIFASVHDPDGEISGVTLLYGYDENPDSSLDMIPESDIWTGRIYLNSPGEHILYYQISAIDNDSNRTVSSLQSIYIQTGEANTDTLTVMTWNILSFPGAMGTQRIPYYRDVVHYINPDILVVQEIESLSGVETFTDEVMNAWETEYSHAPWSDGPDSDNMLFYKNTLYFDHTDIIDTQLRDIAAYFITTTNNNSLVVYSLHLKAGSDYSNQRYQEIQALKDHVNQLEENTHFLICGDFNLYNSSEPAYQDLMNNFPIDVYDPINSPGDWHNNSQFAYLHTQSTRVSSEPDGGSTGGLDDRFDFILTSQPFTTPPGFSLLPDSYFPVGNDGNHLNQAINSGTNGAVPQEIADALYHASDHLPVVLKIIDHGNSNSVLNYDNLPEDYALTLYPNPFNSRLSILAPGLKIRAVRIYSVQGKLVFKKNFSQPCCSSVSWDGTSTEGETLPSGIYFLKVFTSGEVMTGKALLIK